MLSGNGLCGFRVRVSALLPFFTKSFFAVEEHEPVRQLRFLLARTQHSGHFQDRGYGTSGIVRANEAHVFVVFGIVMAGNDDHIFRLARESLP